MADEPESTRGRRAEPAPAAERAGAGAASRSPSPNRSAEVLGRLQAVIGDAIIEHAESFGTLVVRVQPDAWRRAAECAKHDLDCDYLSFIAGIDWQPAPKVDSEEGNDTSSPAQPTEMTFGVAGSAGRFQVFAHVQSTSRHWGVTFKADVDDERAAPRELGAGVRRCGLARARVLGDVRDRVRRSPEPPPPLPPGRVRRPPACARTSRSWRAT